MEKTQLRSSIDLPHSTAPSELGPIVKHTPGDVRVCYECATENGVIWTEIQFRSALAVRFTPECAVSERMVEAYSRIVEEIDSPWLEELETIAAAKHERILPGLRHFMVFFDHHGCLEVLARDAVVQESAPAPR